MLQSLLPRAHEKFRALPLLGSAADGFDDWLAENGYTPKSRKFSIRFLRDADEDLRKRGVRELASLSRSILYDSWRDLIRILPNHAGTIRALARYLNAVGIIETGTIEKAASVSPAMLLSDEYASYLHKVRGCAASTISSHRLAARCFLEHLESRSVALDAVQPGDIRPTSHMPASACAAQVCSTRSPPSGGCFGSFPPTAGCVPDWIARSILPGCTGWSNCLALFPGTQSQGF
jgi:hypothetical protein